ncbi:hypothetical protein DA803_02935 [[Mycoplasma] phocae]|uniref:Tail specific protease domain-containing protein n=1 Tax=[Mycoplasma] phocae TaxID=142651 RepID=A0A2Z5IR10_9BACT|nr:S41 family peptidase [[Mycoplasma] phocae]AXE61024.1 hypothetical protein DA803_02935 [[Mycoplasma] phocae]
MKKTRKFKILTSVLVPLGLGAIAPISLVAASCQNEKNKNDTNREKDKNNKKDVRNQNGEEGGISNITIDPKNDDDLAVRSQKYGFKNFNNEYTIADNELTAYFKADNEVVPYVDVDEALNVLSGFIDTSAFKSYVDPTNNQKVYQTYFKNQLSNQVIFNWGKDFIHATSTSFFYEILKPEEQTNSAQFLKTNYSNRFEDNKGVLFDLKKYGMDIIYKEGKLLLPFPIFNTLFMSQAFTNLYFNGENFTNVSAGVNAFGETPITALERIRKNKKNNQTPTKEEREATYKHFLFVMDHFYGLKQHKKIKSFDSYISDDDKAKFLSTNKDDFNQAYVNIFQKQLNELHTRMNSLSYYEERWVAPWTEILAGKDLSGDYSKKFNANRKKLVENFEKAFDKKIKDFNADDYIKYEGNTAFVTLLRFEDGTKEELAKPDRWKYDTYFLMRYLMEEQLSKKPEIKNIVLNLAINGGGSVSSMVRTLGFMTNKEVLNREYDVLNRRADLSKSLVDTKGNNEYGKNAYEQYNWNILVGINTFSAANQLTSIVKEMGIAKIIGQRTGGGMSAIMPITLLDGTTVTISSPNNAVFGEKNESIEDGIVPDMELPYEKFYDYKYIDSILSKTN